MRTQNVSGTMTFLLGCNTFPSLLVVMFGRRKPAAANHPTYKGHVCASNTHAQTSLDQSGWWRPLNYKHSSCSESAGDDFNWNSSKNSTSLWQAVELQVDFDTIVYHQTNTTPKSVSSRRLWLNFLAPPPHQMPHQRFVFDIMGVGSGLSREFGHQPAKQR
jgi:hypothetical protein